MRSIYKSVPSTFAIYCVILRAWAWSCVKLILDISLPSRVFEWVIPSSDYDSWWNISFVEYHLIRPSKAREKIHFKSCLSSFYVENEFSVQPFFFRQTEWRHRMSNKVTCSNDSTHKNKMRRLWFLGFKCGDILGDLSCSIEMTTFSFRDQSIFLR